MENHLTSNVVKMEELLNVWKKDENKLKGIQTRMVSGNSRYSKKISTPRLEQNYFIPEINKHTQTNKANFKSKNEKLNSIPQRRSENKLDMKGQSSSHQSRLPRLCRLTQEVNKFDQEETEVSKKIKNKETRNENDTLFSNLCQFDSIEESDSLESDYDEERGFAAADNFIMMNQLYKEIEKRMSMMLDSSKNIKDEQKEVKKSAVEEEKEFTVYDNEIDEIIREYCKDFDGRGSEKKLYLKKEETKIINEIRKEESVIGRDDYDKSDNLNQELLKLMKSVDKRVKNYKVRLTDFEQYFHPTEGVTGQKLHNYFQKKVIADKKIKAGTAEHVSKKDTSVVLSENDCNFDVQHPLSTVENRKNLQKLLSDLKSDPFLQKKFSSSSKIRFLEQFSHLGKDNDQFLKMLSKKKLTNVINTHLEEDELKIVKKTESVNEFQIMFSDVSMSEEEEEEEAEKKLKQEQKIEEERIDKESISFKEKCETVIKVLKGNSTTQSTNKSGMHRLLSRYKQNQEEKVRRKNEFARWFGKNDTMSNELGNKLDIPGWMPGWTGLNSSLKKEILKDGWEGKRYPKKRPEGDPVDEFKRILKEYEPLEGKIGLGKNRNEEQIGEKGGEEKGEKWIKIKKGTLMRDYQIRCRQGMYYLVEKKHIRKKGKQSFSKKKVISTRRNNAVQSEKKGYTFVVNKKRTRYNTKRCSRVKRENATSKTKRRVFKQKGEAAKEIRSLLSLLAKKHFDEDSKTLKTTRSKNLEWNRAKLIKYFKEKCMKLCSENRVDLEDDTDDSEETFRKYYLLYCETKVQAKKKMLKKQEENEYPLGLFKPKTTKQEELGCEVVDDLSLSDDLDATSEYEEQFLVDALIKEIFSFRENSPKEKRSLTDENGAIIAEKEKRTSKIEFIKKFYGEQFRFLDQDIKKQAKEIYSEQSIENQVPQHCSDQFKLSPESYKLFFGEMSSMNDKKSKPLFGNKYVIKDKSYLKGDTSLSVIFDKKQVGLINKANYQFLKDEEIFFPWDEIKIEPVNNPCFKNIKVNKFEEEPIC